MINERKKKQFNKRGISGVDIAVAIVVIAIGLSIIVSLIVSINQTASKVNREIEATQVAKSIFEKIKLIPYSNFVDLLKETSNQNYETKLGIDIPEGYLVDIEDIRQTPTNVKEAVLFNIRKSGNIKIEYMLGKERREIKLPYVKYFDNGVPKNKPDLNSTSIKSAKSYSSLSKFIPVNNFLGTPNDLPDYEVWDDYGIKNNYSFSKYAKRTNTEGNDDIFVWVPRQIEQNIDEEEPEGHWTAPKYLIGKTMYSLEPFVKEISFPAGTTIRIIITGLVEQTGTPTSDDQTGTWEYEFTAWGE